MSFNKITVVGNLGKDPELRFLPDGQAVCNFNIASNSKQKVEGEYKDIVTWFKITVWGKQAENAAKYLAKGSLVYVDGRLTIEEWTDRENNNRYTLCVNCSEMNFLSTKQGDGDNGNQASASVDAEAAKIVDDAMPDFMK